MAKMVFPVVCVLVLILSACSPSEIGFGAEVTPPSLPEDGLATVIGQVLDKETGKPLANTIMRLAEVYRDGDRGAYVLDMAFSPGTRTDDKGYFIFENIPAREYVIMVGEYEREYDVIENDDRTARVWNAEANKILDVGVLKALLEP
ncbi:MAG: hypothetical protein JXA78_09515 [Anaerolineales bacterium]|nr:hypothetical protein [Anaerolineales bacterium]